MTEQFNTKEEAKLELQLGFDKEMQAYGFNRYALNAFCPLIKAYCNHSCVCYAEPSVAAPLVQTIKGYVPIWRIIKGSCTNRMFTKD